MQQIGFILQTSNLVPFLTVKQQFQLLKSEKKDVMAQQDFDALIQQLGLESVMNQLPSEISGGQKTTCRYCQGDLYESRYHFS